MVVEVVVEHQYRYPHISLKVRSCTAGERDSKHPACERGDEMIDERIRNEVR